VKYLIAGLCVLIVALLGGLAALADAYIGQRDELVITRGEKMLAQDAAGQCSAGTDELARQAADARKNALRAHQEAASAARAYAARADTVLAAAPAQGGECEAAKAGVAEWWAQR